jgi:hypothetical protein
VLVRVVTFTKRNTMPVSHYPSDWTLSAPRIPGWYWIRSSAKGEPYLLEVFARPDRSLWVAAWNGLRPAPLGDVIACMPRCEWSHRLDPPQERDPMELARRAAGAPDPFAGLNIDDLQLPFVPRKKREVPP